MKISSPWRLAAMLGVCAATSCGAALADPARPKADSERDIRLAFVSELNPDCSSAGVPIIHLVNDPLHGKIHLQSETGSPTFDESNPRQICNQRQVQGVSAYYASDSGYVGDDFVTLHYEFSDGSEAMSDFVITVK